MHKLLFTILAIFWLSSCRAREPVEPGAWQMDMVMAEVRGQRFALLANQSSMVGDVHLVDTLLNSGIAPGQITAVFSPEHGFRGDQGAGERIADQRDPQTGLPILSLYGSRKKPPSDKLEGLDLVLVDLQDVGVRFYTYISTLHHVMEACAEAGVPVVILDRPNPNGQYVDGPVLDTAYRSFVGMHPIPVVHGMTLGELALMINGEGWLAGGVHCELRVIPCRNHRRSLAYSLPIAPSPNLSNDHAIRLYPSTCFFEGTVISEGRGTPWPFEVYGHPELPGAFEFTPRSLPGVAVHPKWEDQPCRGDDLRDFVPEQGWTQLELRFLLKAYGDFPHKEHFFTPFFDKLAGGTGLREQVEAGWSEEAIRASWQNDLEDFRKLRASYLIYD